MENKFSSHSKIYSSYLKPEGNLSTYKTQNMQLISSWDNNLLVLQMEAFKNGYNLTSFPKDTYDVFQASVLSWLGAGSLTNIFKLHNRYFLKHFPFYSMLFQCSVVNSSWHILFPHLSSGLEVTLFIHEGTLQTFQILDSVNMDIVQIDMCM